MSRSQVHYKHYGLIKVLFIKESKVAVRPTTAREEKEKDLERNDHFHNACIIIIILFLIVHVASAQVKIPQSDRSTPLDKFHSWLSMCGTEAYRACFPLLLAAQVESLESLPLLALRSASPTFLALAPTCKYAT